VPDEHAAHTPERKKTIIARRTAHPLKALKSVLLLSPEEDERNLPAAVIAADGIALRAAIRPPMT
jgi:hypothetical protein